MKELKRIEESINLELKYFVDRAKGIWETILFIFKAEKALPVKIKEKFGAVLQFLRDKMFKQTIPIKVFGVL